MPEDKLLRIFFEKARWEKAIQTGVDKEIKTSVLKSLCRAKTRASLYRQLRDGKYKIQPPHEAQIPKDNGEFRTVYVNEPQDRVLLSIANDMLFELCPERVHPNCLSYQTGIGCGKIVQKVSRKIQSLPGPEIGVKIDLSKYFDSVPIAYIDEIFDYAESKHGKSQIVTLLREYYHDDTVLNLNKQPIQKYSSLRQGCAVAAYLADAVLYPIDAAISKAFDVCYFRYSDDILIIGPDWKKAYEMLQTMLGDMQLKLNPKKVEYLYKDRWFKFLGFNLKDNMITLSQTRVKHFQKEILNRTVRNPKKDIHAIINDVQRYLYLGDGEYSWSTSVLPVINCSHDIAVLNTFTMDAIRAGVTGKTKIGGLGCNMQQKTHCILRGTGRHVTENRRKIPELTDYFTLTGMKNTMAISKKAAETVIRDIIM